MGNAVRTILFFALWGLFLGGGLGTIAGTLIMPYIGTMYAGMWGAGMGVVLGGASGIIVALLNLLIFDPDMDLRQYRRRLALGSGIFNAIGAMVLLVVSTEGLLWDQGVWQGVPDLMSAIFLIVMAAGASGTGLASAYTASRYADWYAGFVTKRKNEDITVLDLQLAERRSFLEYVRFAYRFSRMPMVLAGIGGAVLTLTRNPGTAGLFRVVSDGLNSALYVFVVTTLLGLLNAAAITFLNRLFFKEYFPHQPPEKYKVSLMVISFMLTLVASLVVSGGFLSPVVAACAALIARQYADWSAASARTPAGVKRDAAHQTALQRLSDARSAAHRGSDEQPADAREAGKTVESRSL